MKVLLSAFACSPNRGSEPGVGWRWAIEIARRGHTVTVLTQAHTMFGDGRAAIETELATNPEIPGTISFVYFDLPPFIRRFRRQSTLLIYYAVWQWFAYRLARKLHVEQKFDLVHHLTFVTIRHFSQMGRLGIPFVLGPLAGGETSPFWLRWHTGWRGGLRDTFRDFINALSRFDVLHRNALNRAERVAVTSSQTLEFIPRKHRQKARCVLQIGIDNNTDREPAEAGSHKRILYIGRFLYWKGMSVGLDAFSEALKKDPTLRLTLVGSGPEEIRWRRLAERHGIADKINWIPWLSQKELAKVYASHGVLLFPSLHDSGGQVVLEALSHGLPVICLKLGGPGAIVNDNCGRAIETGHGDYPRLVNEMAQALIEYTYSEERWREASKRAEAATARWSWAGRIEELGGY